MAILYRCAVILVFTAAASLAYAGPPTLEDLNRRIDAVNEVMKETARMPDKSIPADLLRRARGIAVFPALFKVGVVLGLSFGDGVALTRDQKTGAWSKPAFYKFISGSVGLQVGAQSTDVILLIMSETALESLLENKLSLGADISVAAGPVGRLASAETGMERDTAVFSYSRSKGLFAGLSLKGASLKPDYEANQVYHGKGVTPQDIFFENLGSRSAAAEALVHTLNDLVK